MRKRSKLGPPSWTTLLSLFVMAVTVLVCLLTQPAPASAIQAVPPGSYNETLEGRIIKLLEEKQVQVGPNGEEQLIQLARVEITKGERSGYTVEVEHGAGLIMTGSRLLQVGDRVLLEHSVSPGAERYHISDYVRLPFLFWLAVLFAAAAVLVGGQVGFRSLISMGFTALIILVFILPRLSVGQDPVFICIAGGLLAMAPSLYLTHGWHWKTHSALVGLALSLVATGVVAAISVEWGRMTGFSTDEATYLMVSSTAPLDVRALLLGGIILGVLGVLDDVCIGQASATLELKRANPTLNWSELFSRGMRIGRDHISALVNTLMMAYVGVALPFLILMMSANAPLLETLNRELVAEEIVRTLTGSLGLFMAVPITSVIASWVAQLQKPDSGTRSLATVTADEKREQHGAF